MKRILAILLSLCVISSTLMLSTTVEASSSVVESAISWAISIANDNSHGYSQSSRWGPDYDCSSLVICAFRTAGVNTGTATYTGNMRSQFTQHGFQWIPWSQIGGVSNLQRGDILLNEVSHTEIYLGNGQNVGAHSNRGYPQTGDQTGTEVSVSGYYNHPWDGVLRYTATEVCTCSTDYAGDYYVATSSFPLTMRSGHGTGYPTVTSIPKDTQVYVSRSDGNWAHVEWNGYSGYCSMEYLKQMEEKSYNLHVWVSDTGMGDVPSEFILGNRYYICYELIDETTGKKVNETNNINYKATEIVRNSSGKVFEYTYENSDNNWISIVCNTEDIYTGTVTVTGDINLSVGVSFSVWAKTGPQIKAWAWEGDDSNEVATINVGKTVYCSYLIRDKYTDKNLNDVTTYWTSGNGYTVTVSIYAPDGSLVRVKKYENNDCAWIDFTPNKIGNYKMVTTVSGNLSGTYEKTFASVESEHDFGAWEITKVATCTTAGTRTRTCSICGTTDTQTIAATEHIFGSWTITTNATCTAAGAKSRTCISCGTKESQFIASTGHKYSVDVTYPTCATKGYTTYVCSCGYGYKDTYTDALGHDYLNGSCIRCGLDDPNYVLEQNSPQIIVGKVTARQGNKVQVTVELKNNPGIWGMDLVVDYDKSQLTLTSVTNGTVFTASEWTPGNLSGGKYILSYEASGFDNITANGVLATLEFTVSENATVDSFTSISLSYNVGDIINVSFDDLNVAIVSGGINITDFVYGDLNSDGLVNKKDSLLMKMYLADNSTTIDMQAADVYVDGSINKKDSLYLKQYLAGLDVELGS